ncbi:MAG: hypothetical protein HQL49_13340 [Gammaproteobacteria bacterium]|nr:hypothetical protein [Gammaproteobacteria bacterium]
MIDNTAPDNAKLPMVILRFPWSALTAEGVNPAPDASYLLSLLTWFGVLTIENQTELNELQLTIPNQVVQSLYIERLQRQTN